MEDNTGGHNGMEIDLHGYHPDDIDVENLIKQAWETGATEVTLIHGHGHSRGLSVASSIPTRVILASAFGGQSGGIPVLNRGPKFHRWIAATTERRRYN